MLDKSKRYRTIQEIEERLKVEDCYKSKTRYLAALIFIGLIVIVLFFLGLILVVIGTKTSTSLEVLLFLFTVLGSIALYFLYKKVYSKIKDAVDKKVNEIKGEMIFTKNRKDALEEAKKLLLA